MTIARAALAVIGETNAHAYCFHVGLAYGLQDVVRLPQARMIEEKHDGTGQPTLQVWEFPDGSAVTRTWDRDKQDFTCTEGAPE